MSHTHKIHSQASADAAPSIIRPAGGFAGLPRPEGCLAWQQSWQGRKRLCEGGRPRGSHTCPEVGPPDGPSTGLSPEFIDVRPSQATLALRASLDKDGGAWSISVQPRLPSLEPPQRPARAGS